MSLVVDIPRTLSAEDAQLMKELADSVELSGMHSMDEASYAQEIGACWTCTACISCRCMVWTYH